MSDYNDKWSQILEWKKSHLKVKSVLSVPSSYLSIVCQKRKEKKKQNIKNIENYFVT